MNLKDLYIEYFVSKDHKQIESASIIPKNDSTLFNTAGMQPLVPYLIGKSHPLGKRLVDYQKCFRLTDLDSVGDSSHHTFFEMLGNWSLGDYFKEESINMSFEFLTKVLNIPVEKLAVSVFCGNEVAPKDSESADIWKSLGIQENRIAYLLEDNWWGQEVGPCGPDTEIFYWRDSSIAPKKFDPEDERWVEIWNNVFMQYEKKEDGSLVPLKQLNVDTGMGYERVTAILEGVNDNYTSSVWRDVIKKIEELSNKKYNDKENIKSIRIIADHIRSIVMISADPAGVVPSNTDRGYILRRLIRRMIRYASKLEIDINSDFDIVLANLIIQKYVKYYPEVEENKAHIYEVLTNEKNKFNLTLEKGLREFNKITEILKKQNINIINGKTAFRLYDTFGFPIEITKELAHESNMDVDVEGFKNCFSHHQEISRVGAEQKFKGGMTDKNDIENIKYHTATHLLHQALKEILGQSVNQKGSNINNERLRFDFSFGRKLTDEEKNSVEKLVNERINEALEVTMDEMNVKEAKRSGAVGLFENKYEDKVKVYTIGDFSKEICGGPHVKNTKELGTFKIIKEEASSAGVRRIKAILY